jgi:hypothetical protein
LPDLVVTASNGKSLGGRLAPFVVPWQWLENLRNCLPVATDDWFGRQAGLGDPVPNTIAFLGRNGLPGESRHPMTSHQGLGLQSTSGDPVAFGIAFQWAQLLEPGDPALQDRGPGLQCQQGDPVAFGVAGKWL